MADVSDSTIGDERLTVAFVQNKIPDTVVRRSGQGQPKATTSTENRYLTIKVHHHRNTIAKDLVQNFAATPRKTIARISVYRGLADKALYT
ncbi:hypothetical protein TNCT_76211 [Trichonephila clavata]|uniref:Uncharacterized protein n=1 Tax=Trichonephila clavata TaxID=2740835 RepID=A0A8X6J879_TRICU|nr:hypothetical protein TNCT_76211 [Trichonephila clavata]